MFFFIFENILKYIVFTISIMCWVCGNMMSDLSVIQMSGLYKTNKFITNAQDYFCWKKNNYYLLEPECVFKFSTD